MFQDDVFVRQLYSDDSIIVPLIVFEVLECVLDCCNRRVPHEHLTFEQMTVLLALPILMGNVDCHHVMISPFLDSIQAARAPHYCELIVVVVESIDVQCAVVWIFSAVQTGIVAVVCGLAVEPIKRPCWKCINTNKSCMEK